MSPHLIGLDWGTTSCRAYLIGADGAVLTRIGDGPGILKVENGTFGATLLEGWEYLERPGTEAILIVSTAALAALVCFRVATLLERYSDDV